MAIIIIIIVGIVVGIISLSFLIATSIITSQSNLFGGLKEEQETIENYYTLERDIVLCEKRRNSKSN